MRLPAYSPIGSRIPDSPSNSFHDDTVDAATGITVDAATVLLGVYNRDIESIIYFRKLEQQEEEEDEEDEEEDDDDEAEADTIVPFKNN